MHIYPFASRKDRNLCEADDDETAIDGGNGTGGGGDDDDCGGGASGGGAELHLRVREAVHANAHPGLATVQGRMQGELVHQELRRGLPKEGLPEGA